MSALGSCLSQRLKTCPVEGRHSIFRGYPVSGHPLGTTSMMNRFIKTRRVAEELTKKSHLAIV